LDFWNFNYTLFQQEQANASTPAAQQQAVYAAVDISKFSDGTVVTPSAIFSGTRTYDSNGFVTSAVTVRWGLQLSQTIPDSEAQAFSDAFVTVMKQVAAKETRVRVYFEVRWAGLAAT
jgi:hypothetical protein